MSLDKDRKRAKKQRGATETPLMLLMGLAATQERLLACISDNDQRKAWDDEIGADMESIHVGIKELDEEIGTLYDLVEKLREEIALFRKHSKESNNG